MSNNHISIQQQFFSPGSLQQQLQDLTPQSSLNRSEMKLLETALPSLPLGGQLEREASPNEVKFYEQYKRIYNISFNLYEQKKRMQAYVRQVLEKVQSIEGRLNSQEQKNKQNKSMECYKKYDLSSDDNRNKRARRTAEEIEKKYQCHAHQCERYYGSEGSLQQHIKLKHPELLRRGEDGEEESGQEYRDHSMPS